MKIYDNAANLIVGTGAASLCRWLGHPINEPPRALPTRLPTTTIFPDSCFERAEREALHIEFQRRGDRKVGLRVLEYDARMRLHPLMDGFSFWHEVIVLGEGDVDKEIRDVGLRFEFGVRYIRNEDHEELLEDPVLAPFAPIADVDTRWRRDVLVRAAQTVLADGRPELLQATRDLANIRIRRDTIDEVWKELGMPIPTSEQYRYEEGLAEGEAKLAEGIAEALVSRFGDDDRISDIARQLAAHGTGWFKRVMAAGSLDDLA
jgi:hypothetical protein